jgi:hypothetical protein
LKVERRKKERKKEGRRKKEEGFNTEGTEFAEGTEKTKRSKDRRLAPLRYAGRAPEAGENRRRTAVQNNYVGDSRR